MRLLGRGSGRFDCIYFVIISLPSQPPISTKGEEPRAKKKRPTLLALFFLRNRQNVHLQFYFYVFLGRKVQLEHNRRKAEAVAVVLSNLSPKRRHSIICYKCGSDECEMLWQHNEQMEWSMKIGEDGKSTGRQREIKSIETI